jgi:hypothetical protein
VCVVARRADKVEEVLQECRVERGGEDGVLGCVADFTQVEDMVRVRNLIAEGTPWNDMLLLSNTHHVILCRMGGNRHSYRSCRCVRTQTTSSSGWPGFYQSSRRTGGI